MTSVDDERARQMAEVLRLHLTEGKGIRAIARATKLGRKKVRKLPSSVVFTKPASRK